MSADTEADRARYQRIGLLVVEPKRDAGFPYLIQNPA